MNEGEFTMVTYKKKRAAGIPVVFKPAEGYSLWRANPNLLASEVVATAQEKVLTHRLNKDGSLIVTVSSLSAVNRLLRISTLAGMTVETRVPQTYMATYGKIQGVPLEYTDKELTNYLRDQGVTSARRQVTYSRDENQAVVESRRRSVILEFKTGSPLPARVFLGFHSFPVTEYVGSATQCFKCQRHGHIAKNCRGKLRCKICSGDHSHKDCTSRNQPCCANCNGPHPASYGACPKKKAATLARSVEQIQGKAPARREPPSNPELVHSTLTATASNPPLQNEAPTSKTYAQATRDQRTPKTTQVTHDALSQGASSSESRRPCREHKQMAGQATHADLTGILIPMLFAAIRALLRANPSYERIPEVEAILSMEPLVAASSSPLRHGYGDQRK